MSGDELRTFIRDFLAGKIFTSAHVRHQNDMGMVFMPLALGAFAEWSEEEIKQIGVLWEYIDQQGPRSVNGNPVFFSLRMMHADDWRRAVKIIEREEKRMNELSLDVEGEEEFADCRSDLDVALDVFEDGSADSETLEWALDVLQRFGILTSTWEIRRTGRSSCSSTAFGPRDRSFSKSSQRSVYSSNSWSFSGPRRTSSIFSDWIFEGS